MMPCRGLKGVAGLQAETTAVKAQGRASSGAGAYQVKDRAVPKKWESKTSSLGARVGNAKFIDNTESKKREYSEKESQTAKAWKRVTP